MDSKFLNKFNNYNLKMHGVRMPSFEIDNKYKRQIGLSEESSKFEFLRQKCYVRLEELKKTKAIKPKQYKEYKERADQELGILDELDFIDYILLVWHVANFCKENDIPIGRGRGSAAGSLVLYLIDVVRVDPIEHGLYFQRFVSKVRAKKTVVDGVVYLDGSLMADVDLDICYYDRHKVIHHLEEKFAGKTSKILTLNTLSGKLVIKECGKIVASPNPISEEDMTRVTSMIPSMYGKVQDIEEAYEEVEEFKEWCDENPRVYNTALKIRGLIKNKGVHPSAIAISYEPLEEICPTELTSDKSSSVTSYDMNWVSLFNVKLDVLGLRGVSVVDRVCKDLGIDPVKDINESDKFIYEQLQDLRCKHGLFQIEADTAYKVCRSVTPENLGELSAVLAIARPGALQFEKIYADVAHGNIPMDAVHPFFNEILEETKGVVLYQEQLMRMAHKMGFSLDEAELLRRIVGKKKVSEVQKWKKKVMALVEKDKRLAKKHNGQNAGEIFWKILEDSANYSFNKSHSIAYASLSAQTVYLKFKHPQIFFLNLLKMTRHEPDPVEQISKIEKELRHFGMKLLPPHILKSKEDFSMEGKNIRFGLLSIKGISEKSIDKIKQFQSDYSSKFEIFQGAEEVKLNLGTLSALIQAGALEGSYGQSRSKIVLEAQLWKILSRREKERCLQMAKERKHDLIDIINHLKKPQEEDGKPFIKESRYGTIKKKYIPYLQIYKQNSVSETFANWYYENSLLGYTHGKMLKDIFSDERQDLVTIEEIEDSAENSRVICIGTVTKGWNRKSKNGNSYYKCIFTDETGEYQAMIFNSKMGNKMDQCKEDNNGLPKEKNIVIIQGSKKDGGVIFADMITVQDCKIFTKLSELKDK
jgi:DNA polymerase-3 subunit alpha